MSVTYTARRLPAPEGTDRFEVTFVHKPWFRKPRTLVAIIGKSMELTWGTWAYEIDGVLERSRDADWEAIHAIDQALSAERDLRQAARIATLKPAWTSPATLPEARTVKK